MPPSPILIVEDEPKLASLLRDYLQQAGYASHVIAHGDQVIDWVRENPPALVLLDIMLPGKDGLTLCRELRQFSSVPIMLATARVEEIDRLLGLELGADDYICKPYSLREVVARVKAMLRRSQITRVSVVMPSSLQLEEDKYRATLHSQPLELTRVEFQLLLTLAREPGRLFSRDQLMGRVYDDHRVVSDRTIDSHIKKLRRKMKLACPDTDYIQSLYGVGYRYEEG